jgi:hypothetical protein
VKEASVRYLCRVEDRKVHAYARTRRDFLLASDDSLWAHESHSWLLAAGSGSHLARRVGETYYDAETGAPLYFETSEPAE